MFILFYFILLYLCSFVLFFLFLVAAAPSGDQEAPLFKVGPRQMRRHPPHWAMGAQRSLQRARLHMGLPGMCFCLLFVFPIFFYSTFHPRTPVQKKTSTTFRCVTVSCFFSVLLVGLFPSDKGTIKSVCACCLLYVLYDTRYSGRQSSANLFACVKVSCLFFLCWWWTFFVW